MRLIIDVDDNDYNLLNKTEIQIDLNTAFNGKEKDRKMTFALFNLTKALKNGTPIPKGKWIVDEDNDIFRFMKCSNCGEVAEWLDGGSQFLSNFCPNCGADMRGGASDANG